MGWKMRDFWIKNALVVFFCVTGYFICSTANYLANHLSITWAW